MMIPGIMAQRRAAGGAPSLWTPLNMATVPQIYLDVQDSVVTDVSGFASAISNLGGMGSDGDFSQGVAANRPAILAAELNGQRVLSFDGTDDYLLGGSAAQKNLMRNKNKGWIFYIVKKRTIDAAGQNRLVFFCEEGVAGSRFTVYAGLSANNTPMFEAKRLDGEARGTLITAAESGVYSMRLMQVNYTTRLGEAYLNGALQTSNATFTLTAGNTSDTPSSRDLSIGAITGAALPSDIDLATMVIDSTLLSAPDIDKLFGWAAHKYGLTANLPSGHPYKTVAPTV